MAPTAHRGALTHTPRSWCRAYGGTSSPLEGPLRGATCRARQKFNGTSALAWSSVESRARKRRPCQGHRRCCLRHFQGGKKIALRGGGDTEAHFPNQPPSLLGRRDGRGGFQGGGARPAVPGGGGVVNPTSMAQNDTHVTLIILTTQIWGGRLLVEKTFSGQILCSCAFSANIRSYTKQRARHGTPFLQPPPPPSAGVHVTPPPRRAIFRLPFQCFYRCCRRGEGRGEGRKVLEGGPGGKGGIGPASLCTKNGPTRISHL